MISDWFLQDTLRFLVLLQYLYALVKDLGRRVGSKEFTGNGINDETADGDTKDYDQAARVKEHVSGSVTSMTFAKLHLNARIGRVGHTSANSLAST